jgi:hypothetical protein
MTIGPPNSSAQELVRRLTQASSVETPKPSAQHSVLIAGTARAGNRHFFGC